MRSLSAFRSTTGIALLSIAFAAGGIFFYGVDHVFVSHDDISDMHVLRDTSGDYTFISPLIACEFSEDTSFDSLEPLQQRVENDISSAYRTEDASIVSVYYRDLSAGSWMGVNENRGYDPASLLKVPLMMAYFREARGKPEVLTEMLTYTGQDFNVGENIAPPAVITIGKEYSVNELLEAMIRNSDNNAFLALYKHIDKETLATVYTDLGLTVSEGNQVSIISPKQYSLFFRLLYNSSYLGRANSERALKLLSEVAYTDGIAKGAPAGTLVAHKFGERGSVDGNQELHDCGIVYAAGHPYMLCVMTRGSDIQKLQGVIQEISKTVYEYVEK